MPDLSKYEACASVWPHVDPEWRRMWIGAALEAFFGVVREAHALALIESWRAARDGARADRDDARKTRERAEKDRDYAHETIAEVGEILGSGPAHRHHRAHVARAWRAMRLRWIRPMPEAYLAAMIRWYPL